MIPYIEKALSGEKVYSQNILNTTWGHIFTACYPIKDKERTQEERSKSAVIRRYGKCCIGCRPGEVNISL